MRRTAGGPRLALATLALLGSAGLAACTSEPAPTPPPSVPVTTAPPPSSAPASEPPSATPTPSPSPSCPLIEPITLAVSGPAQARYAGYLAAAGQGAYDQRCLEVTVLDAGEDPLTAISEGRADFAVAALADGLRARERGIGVVDVAQVFQRSDSVEIAFAASGIASIDDLRGRKVAILRGTDGLEPIAAMLVSGLDPVGDLRVVDDPAAALLVGDVDAAQTSSFEGVAQLVESTNPESGAPYRLTDFTVLSLENEGVGLLGDGIWAAQDRLADPVYQDLAQRFVTGSLAGWISCRDDAAACADSVASAGSATSGGGLLWRINQVNALVWPSPAGAGVMDQSAVDRAVNVLLNTKTLDGAQGLGAAPAPEAWTDQFARAADDALRSEGLDVTGDGYAPADVPLGSAG